ncbi:MAG: cytidine deaminase [Bacteroidales bacterium]|nr:cytidine deaminase [Bacteroidales bacterium]
MERKELIVDYSEYASVAELADDERELMERAMETALNAYAPYSHFHVGAAVQMADGTIVTGSNQENVAYPSGLCAERVAMYSASAQNPGQTMTAMAIVGYNEGEYCEASPCGACRQVMAEYEQCSEHEMTVLCYLAGGRIRRIRGVKSLLPFTFEAQL